MAEEFKDVIAQLQENNKLEAKRDSNLNKNIAYSREVNTSKFDALQGQMVIQTEVTKVPDEKVPDEKVPDESDYERVERAREKNKESDTGAAETEENAEKESGEKKTRNLLTKIAGGIGGILSSMKDSAKRALKGGLSFLKKTLFAGAILAILAFINSKYWDDFVNWAAEGAVFLSQKIIPAIKKLGETFSGIADFLGLTNTELALYGLGGMFAFKIISKVLRIGKSLLAVGKFITSGLITPLVNVAKLAGTKAWKAIKGIGTVFKSVRLFMMSNIINPMADAVKFAVMKSWNLIKTLPTVLATMRTFMMTNIINPMRNAVANALTASWNLIKTLPTVLATMRTFMMTNILNPLLASGTAAKAKLWAFMSKITKAISVLRVFFMASFLPMIAGFMVPLMPIILIGAGIALVLGALWSAFKDFKETLARTGSIGEAVKVAIGKFVGFLAGAIPALFLKLVAFVADLFGFKEFAKKIKDIDPIQFIADAAVNFMNKIGKFFGSLFNIDFKGLLDQIVPDFVKNSWLGRQLGYTGSDAVTPEQAKQARIEELEKKKATLGQGIGYGGEAAKAAKIEIAKAQKELDEIEASGKADVQKALNKQVKVDVLTKEEIAGDKALSDIKTKKQTNYTAQTQNVMKNTAREVSAASTITDLSAGFAPTSSLALTTAKNPVIDKQKQLNTTMQTRASENAAKMGIGTPASFAQISDSSTKVVDNSSTSTSINTRTLGNPDPILGYVANSR